MVRNAPKRIEAAIQRAHVAWVRERYPHVKVVATLNENNRHCMDLGCDEGIVDLLMMDRVGDTLHVLFNELKKKKGTLQDNQIAWAVDYDMRYASTNTSYAVSYGYEEANKNVVDWQERIHYTPHTEET